MGNGHGDAMNPHAQSSIPTTARIGKLLLDQRPDENVADLYALSGWLVQYQVDGNGCLRWPYGWSASCLDSLALPFSFELHLEEALSPEAERRLAEQIRPWMKHSRQMIRRGRALLWVHDPERLSHSLFASQRLRGFGCDDIWLLSGGAICPGFDAGYGRPRLDDRCQITERGKKNYLSHLYWAHYRPLPNGPWVPGLLPWCPSLEADYEVVDAAYGLEWLGQAEAWSGLWNQANPVFDLVLLEGCTASKAAVAALCHVKVPVDCQGQAPASCFATVEKSRRLSWGEMDGVRPAIAIHAFWLEELAKLLTMLQGAESNSMDLYVSTPLESLERVASIVQSFGWRNVIVFGCENRGRDVAPFLLDLFPAMLHHGHPWFLKLHTKRSSHLSSGGDWAKALYSSLLEGGALQKIRARFDLEPRLGLIAPRFSMIPASVKLHGNAHHLRSLLAELGWPGSKFLQEHYVVGTMFAARLEPLKSFLELPITRLDFEQEVGQLDGTLAHALERLISAIYASNSMDIEFLSADLRLDSGRFGYFRASP